MSKHTHHENKNDAETQAPINEEAQQEKPEAGGGNELPEARIAELEGKLAEVNDQLLRKAADFENYRKRMAREKQEMVDFANQSLLLDLLPVIDDFGRAIRSAENSRDFTSFYEGVIMIEKRFASQLESKWGLKGFDSVGEPFDPNRHEAVQVEKAEGIAEPVVKEDYEKGYLLKDRVVRFAKVKVLMPESKLSSERKPSTDEGAEEAQHT